jgi:hypothetical protein
MKALSIKQPWASLIASGRKTIELRTWQTKYRGDFIVCASCSPRRGTEFEIGPMAAAICVVTLDRIEPADASHAKRACCSVSPGEFAWRLTNVREFEPFPIKGRLSFWEPTPELMRHIRKQLGSAL